MNKFVHCKNTIFLNNRFRNSNRLKKYAKFKILIIYFLKIFQILTFLWGSISVFEPPSEEIVVNLDFFVVGGDDFLFVQSLEGRLHRTC